MNPRLLPRVRVATQAKLSDLREIVTFHAG
jgi:hypothetical protein